MSQVAAAPDSDQPLAWLLLDAGEFQWLVPNNIVLHVGALEPDGGRENKGSGGGLFYNELSYPVVYWDKALHLMPRAPKHCRSAVLLQTQGGRLALACNHLRRLEQSPTFHALPVCMQGRRQPFVEIAILNGQVVGRFDDQRLAAIVPRHLWQVAADPVIQTGTAS